MPDLAVGIHFMWKAGGYVLYVVCNVITSARILPPSQTLILPGMAGQNLVY